MQETWHIVHIKPYPPHTISHLKHPTFSVNCSNMQWHPCLVLGLSCWQWHHRSIIPSSCQNVHMPKIASKFRSRNLISTEPLWWIFHWSKVHIQKTNKIFRILKTTCHSIDTAQALLLTHSLVKKVIQKFGMEFYIHVETCPVYTKLMEECKRKMTQDCRQMQIKLKVRQIPKWISSFQAFSQSKNIWMMKFLFIFIFFGGEK